VLGKDIELIILHNLQLPVPDGSSILSTRKKGQ